VIYNPGKPGTSFTRFLFLAFIAVIFITGCSKERIREKPVDPPDPIDSTSFKSGIFVVNEGNFNWGNASVTYIDRTTGDDYNNLFQTVNERPLGDVAQSMKTFNNKGYIIVNNSNTVEVVSLDDFKSVASIKGFSAPRYLEVIDSSKAYVTNMKGDISVVDLNSSQITKTIPTGEWTEAMIRYQSYIFVTCVGKFSESTTKRKAKLLVINTKDDRIVDSIQTGKEPLGIVIDKKEKIWVLSTGGWDNVEPATLIRVNPDLMQVEKVFVFPASQSVPSRLSINPSGDTLYFLKNGVFQMPVTAGDLPSDPFIQAGGKLFYGLGIDPANGTLWTTDAVDYVSNGKAYHYSQSSGTLIGSFETGRIPGSFCFPNQQGKKK
jgi:hypothetical protein